MNLVKRTAVAAALLAIFTLSFYSNIFKAAPPAFFQDYQHDSETLVIARLVAAQNGLPWPKDSHLGFISASDFVYEAKYVYQAYTLLKNDTLPPLSIKAADYSDANWTFGLANRFAGILTNYDPLIARYVGRKISISGGERVIKAVEPSGRFTAIYLSGEPISPPDAGNAPATALISGEPPSSADLHITPYLSQFGLQGQFFLDLSEIVGHSLKPLYAINSILCAAAIVALTLLYSRLISRQFAFFFFAATLLSPWVTAYARNLYWVPFTWYLPAVFALGYAASTSRTSMVLFGVMVYLSILIKCLSGYEYISSVILFSAAPFMYFAIAGSSRASRARWLRQFFIICVVGVLAFLTALLMHADIRAGTIVEGLRSIYEGDIKRRTYGDPAKFGPENFAALSASPLQVLKIYVINWHTDLIKFIPGGMFKIFALGSVVVVAYRLLVLRSKSLSDIALLVAFALAPVSWYILAKGHSFIHTQLNFVLWYLGFVPALFHVCFNGIKLFVLKVSEWTRTVRIEEI